MRLPLTIDLMTRDGSVEKDQKLVNSHSSDDGVNKRPGVTDLGLVEAGVAQLLACWNGLLSVIGDSLAELVITGSSVTPTPVADLSPITPNLIMASQSTGAAQSQQQMLIKSTDQAWIYTP